MKKVLFVCLGNICRSPMAEFVFKDMVAKRGLADEFYIESCATSTEEIWNGVGNPVYPPAKRELAKHGISCEGKRARQITKADYDRFDIILCMDDSNMRDMRRMLGGDPEGKLIKLLSLCGESADVADPWYTGDFAATWRDVSEGCTALLGELRQRHGL